MSGLLGDLLAASRALQAQSVGVQVAGRNISNVNTPGYARQRVMLGEGTVVQTPVGPAGTGVEVLGIKQIRDTLLDAQVTREGSRTSYLDSLKTALEKAQSALGEQIDRSNDPTSISDIESQSGVSGAISDFFNAFDQYASNPTDPGAKQVLLQTADALAAKFNLADSRLSNLQADLTTQISSDVNSANTLLSQIAELNNQIQGIEVGTPGGALELRDQRQQRLEELSKFLNFSATNVPNSVGQIQITVKDSTGADVVILDRSQVIGGISFNGATFTGGNASATLGLTGGSLAANLTARDSNIAQLRTDLQNSATQFAEAVNAAYNPTAAGGQNFFEVPPATGLMQRDPALSFTTLRATASGNAGANELALAVVDVASRNFSTTGGDLIDGKLSEFYSRVVTGLGQSIDTAGTQLEDQRLIESMVTRQRESVSGVSMDEEVADLMKFQRAFQASSRVISVIDSMLESLIASVG